MGAMQYTDDILRNLEISISHAMDSAKARHENYMSSLQEFYDVVSSNRAELNPAAEDAKRNSKKIWNFRYFFSAGPATTAKR